MSLDDDIRKAEKAVDESRRDLTSFHEQEEMELARLRAERKLVNSKYQNAEAVLEELLKKQREA